MTGIPDSYGGEAVKALVALGSGAALIVPTLLALLRDRVSLIETPQQLESHDIPPVYADQQDVKERVGGIGAGEVDDGAERPL